MDKDEQQLSEQDIKNKELEVQEALSDLPAELLIAALQKRDPAAVHITQTQQVIRQFTGPLPSPEMLLQYEQTHPGLANRIVAMAESEQQHRHHLETKNVEGMIGKDKRGQVLAFLITCLITMISAFLIYAGHPILGSLFGGATLVALVSLFLGGKQRQNKQSSSKNGEDENE